MIIQGQVGALATAASLPSGQQAVVRQGNMGDVIVSELHGRYYETTYRRAGFLASTVTGQTATAFTSGTTTALVGLTISNPVNSPVNLVLNKVGIQFTVAFAAVASIGLAIGYNSGTNVTHTTAATVRNAYVGVGAAGYGLVDTSATVPTAPNTTHIFGAGMTGATTTIPYIGPSLIDLEGSVILPPGGYAAIVTSAASGTSGAFYSIGWEETPL
jgi:hypothetical protein